MKAHEMKVQACKDAIDAVLSDTSVSASRTRADLQDVRDHLDTLIESLPDEGDEG